jgi:hypothetical protein
LLLQSHENRHKSAAGFETSERFADDRAECACGIARSHGVPWRWRRSEQVTECNRRAIRINFAPGLSGKGKSTAVGVDLTVQDDAGPVVARTRHNASNAVIIRLVANAYLVVAGEHDDASGIGLQMPDHSKLFGEVRTGQLHVAVHTQVLRDVHVPSEHTRKAATSVDGSQGGRTTLRLRVDPNRTGA